MAGPQAVVQERIGALHPKWYINGSSHTFILVPFRSPLFLLVLYADTYMSQARSLSGDTLYDHDERTPLLTDILPGLSIPTYSSGNGGTGTPNSTSSLLSRKRKKKPTPLPKLQLAIVLILQICEPIMSQSIYPYINQVSILVYSFETKHS